MNSAVTNGKQSGLHVREFESRRGTGKRERKKKKEKEKKSRQGGDIRIDSHIHLHIHALFEVGHDAGNAILQVLPSAAGVSGLSCLLAGAAMDGLEPDGRRLTLL